MADIKKIPPLDWQTPMVDPETGHPSAQFLRLWQEMFQNGDAINEDVVGKADKATLIETTAPLTGGGDLSEDRVIGHDESGATPGTYGDTGYTPKVTVDEFGHITNVVDVPAAGGIQLEEAGVPITGGPFSTLNVVSGATIVDATGGTADITIEGGGGDSATQVFIAPLSDETTDITTGAAKYTMRMPYAFFLTGVRASLATESSSGNPTVDINLNGSTILSTKLSIDSGEKTSVTSSVPAVVSDQTLPNDGEITFDIDTAGTGAKGLKAYLIGYLDTNPPAVDTDYLQDISTGDRTGIISMQNNGIEGNIPPYTTFIDGNLVANNNFFYNRTTDGNQNLRFDMGSPRVVDEFKWYQQATPQGTWVMEGSPDDSTWTTLGASFTLDHGTFPFANSTAYRYYRLRNISGSRSSGPYIYEIEFKAGPP